MKKVLNKKTFRIIVIIGTAVVVSLSIFFGIFFGRMAVNPQKFNLDIDSSGVYQNETGSRIPQTALYGIMSDHFWSNESGKAPKLLFIGYDGCIANAVPLLKNDEASAVFRLAEDGGLYLSYAGGEKPGDQDTSTAPGWASTFTGVWAKEHGVYDNSYTVNEETRSIVYRLGEGNFSTSYITIWEPHITVTYKHEVQAAKENNFSASYVLTKNNAGIYTKMLERVNGGGDAIFGIFEQTDNVGHTIGFTVKNKKYMSGLREAEAYASRLIGAVESRATYLEEDWLIIIASDHGGHYLYHGGKTPMESTTFFALNKPFPG